MERTQGVRCLLHSRSMFSVENHALLRAQVEKLDALYAKMGSTVVLEGSERQE